MVDINPFCDSDIRNGLLFLSGVNLFMILISIAVDGLAIFEVVEYSSTWETSSFYLPVYAGIALLACDILANLLQLFCGWVLYSSVTRKAYGKISKLYYPFFFLLIPEFAILVCYLVCIPSSPFFYYFSLFTFLYKAFLLWPMKKFINDHSHHHYHNYRRLAPPISERTRLLASVG